MAVSPELFCMSTSAQPSSFKSSATCMHTKGDERLQGIIQALSDDWLTTVVRARKKTTGNQSLNNDTQCAEDQQETWGTMAEMSLTQQDSGHSQTNAAARTSRLPHSAAYIKGVCPSSSWALTCAPLPANIPQRKQVSPSSPNPK